MKVKELVFVALIICTWFIEDLYHLFPKMAKIKPFLFSQNEITWKWFIWDISNYIRFIIFSICILLLKIKTHWIVIDSVKITLILFSFSLIWYLTFYGNPFYKQELWVKTITTGVIYLIIFINSKRWKFRPQY